MKTILSLFCSFWSIVVLLLVSLAPTPPPRLITQPPLQGRGFVASASFVPSSLQAEIQNGYRLAISEQL
jgi:hypothetical protein